MDKLNPKILYSLEEYARIRPEFRAQVMAHKRCRQVALGEHATLYFESLLTMHYQVQEMLRVERIFEAAGIQEELDTYNPLVPDGSNWKATFMLEYTDPTERAVALAKMMGIENQIWVQIGDFDQVFGIADEDLERTNKEKTSSVHFLRFELTPAMVKGLKQGTTLNIGVQHKHYHRRVDGVAENIKTSLLEDLA